ncbi:SIR2 family protein [Xenorhabdus sp. PB30.3]|uniref:SIR2 family protein n=1 Tax=Xenorhabdus sp. PB30.3 TaxID=2788941 RepID=UPI001E5E1A71|nr:SIR2 family protein [Xenorhabdus sp. PB30.3]MCC8382033.1 SIR2 family protein [Xenorhabdus sp. PB30.3]
MTAEFNLHQIYDHNLNFLIGAGASHGFLPTLALEMKLDGSKCTFETLAKKYENNKDMTTLLFMLYYRECIKPGLPLIPARDTPTSLRLPDKESVIQEYKRFMTTLIHVLNKQKPSAKKANIFTTNYDNCFEIVSEELMAERTSQFNVNDGSTGFQARTFHTKNFNNRIVNKGVFDRHEQFLPQVNLLHAHGSVHWMKGKKDGDIELNYGTSCYNIEFNQDENNILDACKVILDDTNKSLNDLSEFELNTDFTKLRSDRFWQNYDKMPIVNPTKWKFYETVFEEAYYQILRHLSYELERPNSELIVFGFSFADEHILSLVQRALSNPSLTMYVMCYDKSTKYRMSEIFKEYPNVKLIYSEDSKLDFKLFNDEYFTINKLNKPMSEETMKLIPKAVVGGVK